MYILFSARRSADYYNNMLVADYVTKYQDEADKRILSWFNNIKDYLLVEVTNDEFKYLDGNEYLYNELKEK